MDFYTLVGYIHANKKRKVTIKHCSKIDGVWHRPRYYKHRVSDSVGFDYIPLTNFIVDTIIPEKEEATK